MDSLTKENFWNDLMAKYPEEMKEFCGWIDDYKIRVNWLPLFNVDSDYQNYLGKNAPAPKYHDLPIAMQIGIFMQFASECGWFAFLEINIAHAEHWELMPAQIQDFFKEEHDMRVHLKNGAEDGNGKIS